MTGSPIRLPCAGKPALKTATTHRPNKPESSTSLVDLPALNSIRQTASPSRPCGRDAVGLRPSLDPDAYFDAPSQDNRRGFGRVEVGSSQNEPKQHSRGLDRPLSFRNDLRESWSG